MGEVDVGTRPARPCRTPGYALRRARLAVWAIAVGLPASGGLQTLTDFDEWANIQAASLGAVASGLTFMPMSDCITAAEAEQIAALGGCSQPAVASEPCENRRMIYLRPNAGAGANGNCAAPYNSVQAAHDAASDGSVLHFRAGSYPQDVPVILTRPMKLFNQPTSAQATAVITAP